MFCQKCGKEIMDEAVACPHCGCATKKGAKSALGKKRMFSVFLVLCIVFAVGLVICFYKAFDYGSAVRFYLNKMDLERLSGGNPSQYWSAVNHYDAMRTTCYVFAVIDGIVILSSLIGIFIAKKQKK